MKTKLYVVLAIFSFSFLTKSVRADDDGRAKDLQKLKTAFNGELTEAQLVLKGFTLAQQTKGDLNGDGVDDIALVLHRDLPKKAGPEGDEGYDLPQFVLVFKGSSANRFQLWMLGEHHFTNAQANQMSENGIADLSIHKGVLTIASDFAQSMGGWSSGGCTQKWRNEKSGFALIGLTLVSTDRKCGECGTYRDTNFLSRKQDIKKISDDPENPKTSKKTVAVKEGPVEWNKFNYEKRCLGD